MIYHWSTRTEYAVDLVQLIATTVIGLYLKRVRWIEVLTVHMFVLLCVLLDYIPRMRGPDVTTGHLRGPALFLIWAAACIVLFVYVSTADGAWLTASADVIVAIVTGRVLTMDMVRIWHSGVCDNSILMYGRIFMWLFFFVAVHVTLIWTVELLSDCLLYKQFIETSLVATSIISMGGAVLAFLVGVSLLNMPHQQTYTDAPIVLSPLTHTSLAQDQSSSDDDFI